MPTFDDQYITFQQEPGSGPGARTVRIRIYDNRANVRNTSTNASIDIDIAVYAIWQNGEGSLPIISSKPGILKGFSQGRFTIDVIMNYNQVRNWNICDRIVFEYNNQEYIINFNQFDIIEQLSLNQFTVNSPQDIMNRLRRVDRITFHNDDTFTIQSERWNRNPNYDLYIRDFINFENLLPNITPIKITTNPFTETYQGTLIANRDPAFWCNVGRGVAGDNSLILFEQLDNIPLPPTIDPIESIVSRSIVTTEDSLRGNQYLVKVGIFPEIPMPINQRVRVFYRKISEPIGPTETTVFNYTGLDNYALFPIQDGEHYTVRFVEIRVDTDPNTPAISPTYSIMRMGEIVTRDNQVFDDDILKHTKFYVDKITSQDINIVLLNDFFNDDRVDKVIANISGGDNPFTYEFQNNVSNSEIDCKCPLLLPDTLYAIQFDIYFNETIITLDAISFKTLEILPDNANRATKAKHSAISAIRKSYDYDDTLLIENLEDTQIITMGQNALQQINNPQADQRPHDFNKKNKKGSVFNSARSPAVYTQFRETLESLLAQALIDVPDIDEGFRV